MKQGSGIRVGRGFDLITDKRGKQELKPKKTFRLSFTQQLAKKAAAKKPKYGKPRT